MPTVGLRAAEYAGWWGGPPRMRTTISANLAYSDPWLVTPRYYQDNPAVGYQNANMGGATSPSGGQINTTGLTNTAGYITAMTIKYGTNYLATAPSGTGGAVWYDRFASNGTDYYPNLGLIKGNGGQYVLATGTPNGGGASVTIANFDTGWRNTWLTFIVAVSTTSSSFANWSGTGTGSYYTRVAIVNAQTGQLIQSLTDAVSVGTVVTKDFSQNWYFTGSGSPSYNYGPFFYTQDGDWSLYANTDFDVASIWHGWDVLDPGVYYSQLSGAALSPTVGGLNSTFMCQFTGAGTRNSGDDGFYITIGGNGSRMPSDVVYTTDTNQNTSTNSPALVSF